MAKAGQFVQPATKIRSRHVDSIAVASVAVLVTLLGILYHTILYRMGVQWYDEPDYSHGFLVPFMAAYFVWERRERLLAVPVQPSLAGIGLLGVGLVMLI